MKKVWKRWLTLFMAICLAVVMALPALASTDSLTEDDTATDTTGTSSADEDDDVANGVLQVWLEFVDDNNNVYQLSGGSCFLINDEYVLTNYHVVNPNEEYGTIGDVTYTIYEFCMEYFGLSKKSEVDSHLQISIYGYRDASVTASIVENCYSETTDFAALQLSSKIGSRTVLSLGDSDEVKVADTVISYGFPSTSIENKEYNTADDVSVTIGNVSKVTTTGSIDYIEHTADINTGNSGGPLVDEDGNVIGINSFMYTNYLGTNYYAIQINTIKNYLDNALISYTDGTATAAADAEEEEEEEEEEEVEETASEETLASLQSKIDEAQEYVDSGKYTDESTQVLEKEITSAQSVYSSGTATDTDVNNEIDALNTAISALEEKSGIPLMYIIIGIIIAAVVIVVIIVILVMRSKKKKQAGNDAQANSYTGAPNGPQTGAGAGYGTTAQADYQQQNAYGVQNDGAGETTLLDSGAGETTLLGGSGGAYLIRRKNGEKIMINSANFSLGKERKRVSYCISDNTSVSRFHAVIAKKGNDFYITDQKSSNFTYVNGVQVGPYAETLLTDQSVVKLADEEFEFHLS